MKVYGDKIWQKIFSTQQWGKYPPEHVVRWFFWAKRNLNAGPIRALDIGCGTGACSWFMSGEGAKVSAIDGSLSGLKKVNFLAKSFGVSNYIETIHGDITEPSTYLTDQYDLLLDNFALYSNNEDKFYSALENYRNLLCDNGFFLMACFGEGTSGYGTGRKLSENTYTDVDGVFKDRGVVTFFNRNRLNEILVSLNYKIIYFEDLYEKRESFDKEMLITVISK
jgi:SAM-dependent methyltransferase